MLMRAICGALLTVAGMAPSRVVRAQPIRASADARATVTRHVSTTLTQILRVRAVGAPVLRSDGRMEQRYEVLSNVSFQLRSSTGADDVRYSQREREVPLTAFEGRAGYYAEIIVRAADASSLGIVAVPVSAGASATEALGR